ncbi:hypothetical protein Nepgr_023159 [Nepenthes gracilis]|uniref:Uncharacterized protein n=1 Tax=Nepenthes gracilis TaxID=150966 RepID=A0AAD3T3C5_NEPGR|nr:hypothetical protein Nepgr_023159 [Nepenthes gracilis]
MAPEPIASALPLTSSSDSIFPPLASSAPLSLTRGASFVSLAANPSGGGLPSFGPPDAELGAPHVKGSSSPFQSLLWRAALDLGFPNGCLALWCLTWLPSLLWLLPPWVLPCLPLLLLRGRVGLLRRFVHRNRPRLLLL